MGYKKIVTVRRPLAKYHFNKRRAGVGHYGPYFLILCEERHIMSMMTTNGFELKYKQYIFDVTVSEQLHLWNKSLFHNNIFFAETFKKLGRYTRRTLYDFYVYIKTSCDQTGPFVRTLSIKTLWVSWFQCGRNLISHFIVKPGFC